MSRAALWVGGLAACATLLAACAILQPLDAPSKERVRVDWAAPLYELASFSYEPTEPGQARFVSSPATPEGGLLVVPSTDRHVRGIEAASGKVLWALPTRGPNIAAPAVVEEELVIGSSDGHVYRVYQRNGGTIWVSDYPGKGGIVATPTVHDGRVFVTSIDNRITALKFEDGTHLWDKRRPHVNDFTITGQAGATIVGDAVVTGFSDGQVYAYAAEDGATLWSTNLAGKLREFVDVDTTPVLSEGVIAVASYKRGLFGLSPDGGDVLWLLEGEAYGTPAAHEGTLYVPQATGRLIAVNAADGQVQWVSKFPSGWATTPTVTEHYLLAPTRDSLALIDRGSGRTLERFDDMRGVSATPEFAYGTAYVVANSGTVYALGIFSVQ